MAKSHESKIDTIIGAGGAIHGDIEVDGSLLISGRIEGNVQAANFVRVAENAVITGNLETESTIISGRVEGNVMCSDRVQLAKSAVLMGDIRAARLSIEEGAVFSGKSMMHEDANRAEPPEEEEQTDDSGTTPEPEAE